jgi:hypothetical protein
MLKKLLLFILIALITLLPTTIALANSAAPPSVVWFTLVCETGHRPRLEGIQLVGCPTEQCEQPVLLQQYGTCEADGCLPPPVTLPDGFATSFGCAADQCRGMSYNDYGGMDFKLVAQFSDQVRSSPLTSHLPSEFSEVVAWNVIVGETDLSLTPDATIPTLNEPYELFPRDMAWLGLSILVELLVAGVCFYFLTPADRSQWLNRLLVVLLVNLATFSSLWLFFPAFGQFHRAGSRYLGVIAMLVSVFYMALLVIIYRSPRKVRRWAIPLTVLGGLLTGFGCSFLLLLAYFGGATVYVQGLSLTLVILLSEIYAFIVEAVLITVLLKLPLKTRWVWITSLLMNAASFIVGLILIGRWG